MEDESVAVSSARANLSEVVASVRLQRRCVTLTQRGKPRAAVVPAELADAARAVGGPDEAARLLRELSL